MQNQTLPIQLSPTAVAPAPAKASPQPSNDGAAFSQSLNREMAQRQAAAADQPPPASAPASAPPKPTLTTPPVKQGAAQPATGPVRAAQKPASADNAADTEAVPTDAAAPAADPADALSVTIATTDPDTAAAAAAATEGAAAATPMADMLAMVANYQKLLQGGAPAATPGVTNSVDEPAAAVPGASLAADTQTLAALQTALKNNTATGQDAAPGKPAVRATQAGPDDSTPAVKSHAVPDLAAVAARAAPQSDAALSTLRDAATTATLKDTAPVTGSAFQAQLTSAAMVQTAVTPASDHIPARLGTTAWDNQVSQKVVWMVGGQDQTASLTLNPPDLGPVQVVLNVNNDQATVAFSSATPEVREALENAMPRLREMMSEAGVTLGDASVSANLPDQRQADTSSSNGGRQNGNNGGNGTGVRRGETEIPLPRSATSAARADGAVDTFA
jgi:flagellar hook-length control protein FliK